MPVTQYLVPVVVGTGGLTAMIAAASGMRFARRSLQWPVANGQVKSSDLRMRWRKSLIPSWDVVVVYTYLALDQPFESDRVFFGDWCASSDRAVRIAKRYPMNTEVRVHYDPQAPSRAVLEPGLTRYPIYGMLIGVTLVAVAVLVWRS